MDNIIELNEVIKLREEKERAADETQYLYDKSTLIMMKLMYKSAPSIMSNQARVIELVDEAVKEKRLSESRATDIIDDLTEIGLLHHELMINKLQEILGELEKS